MKTKILLVEDEATLAMIVEDMLCREGYTVVTARNGEEGLEAFAREKPHAVIADVMMPRMDGFEMVKRMRRTDYDTPVLFLTARSAIDDIVTGFELGGNDYLKKPFRMEELLVRLKALLRRGQKKPEETSIGRYTFSHSAQTLTLNGRQRELTYFESIILNVLATHRNEAVDARTLMMQVWQNDDPYNLNRLHGFIFKLRRYLSADASVSIVNIRGIGYKLIVKDGGQ